MPIVTTAERSLQHQVLDPCLLGRPVHLLPQFATQMGEDLAGAMRASGARRYWDGFQLESVAFVRAPEPGRTGRWLSFACAHGTIGFSIERPVLLGVLNHRYGRRAAAAPAAAPAAEADTASEGAPDTAPLTAPAPAAPTAVRVTATEERLAVSLGQQLAALLAARISANLARASAGDGTAAPEAPAAPKAIPGRVPAKGSWTIGVVLREVETGNSGHYWLALEQGVMAIVMQGLVPERTRVSRVRRSVAPLASTLKVTVGGRLVSKEITLDTLFAMKVGDVIPVSLGRAEVLLADSCLFTAAVSEHNGMLCLTSFEDSD